MTTASVTPGDLGLESASATAAAAPAAPPNAFLAGNPGALGIPVFVAGSVALGLTLIGYVPRARQVRRWRSSPRPPASA